MAGKNIFFTDGKGGIYKIEKFVKAAVLVNLETKETVTAEMLGSQVSGFVKINMPAADEIVAVSARPVDEAPKKTSAQKPKKRKSKSGYYGVTTCTNSKKNPWRGKFWIKGVGNISAGSHPTEEKAAKAVDGELVKRGRPARNFPQARKEG